MTLCCVSMKKQCLTRDVCQKTAPHLGPNFVLNSSALPRWLTLIPQLLKSTSAPEANSVKPQFQVPWIQEVSKKLERESYYKGETCRSQIISSKRVQRDMGFSIPNNQRCRIYQTKGEHTSLWRNTQQENQARWQHGFMALRWGRYKTPPSLKSILVTVFEGFYSVVCQSVRATGFLFLF